MCLSATFEGTICSRVYAMFTQYFEHTGTKLSSPRCPLQEPATVGALMSPMQFTSSSKDKPDVLTQEQLKQAMLYMIEVCHLRVVYCAETGKKSTIW